MNASRHECNLITWLTNSYKLPQSSTTVGGSHQIEMILLDRGCTDVSLLSVKYILDMVDPAPSALWQKTFKRL